MTSTAWLPTATIDHLRERANMLQNIRQFFSERAILEVETPLLASATTTDPALDSLSVRSMTTTKPLYLQTSPEFAMKRLLAAGSGSIYQISKAFRDDEQGRHHHLEFSLLEWYEVGSDHWELMASVEALFRELLSIQKIKKISYAEAFQQYAGLCPHRATLAELQACAKTYQVGMGLVSDSLELWLDVLLTQRILPQFSSEVLLFLYDFPAPQAALAKIRPGDPPVAERFEVYFKGVELANGYHELTCPKAHRQRVHADQAQRQYLGKAPIAIDDNFLSAIDAGLPACAGVAVGLDRLAMLRLGCERIQQVMAMQ